MKTIMLYLSLSLLIVIYLANCDGATFKEKKVNGIITRCPKLVNCRHLCSRGTMISIAHKCGCACIRKVHKSRHLPV